MNNYIENRNVLTGIQTMNKMILRLVIRVSSGEAFTKLV